MLGSRKITCRIAYEPDARESIEPVAFKHGSAEWEDFFSTLVCSFQSPLLPSKHHLDDVRQWSNRAEDWIASCRDYPLPNTNGSFISFKDSSVRTEDYFGTSYDELKRIKRKCVMDSEMLFKTDKTII
jgi:hypothetical protein